MGLSCGHCNPPAMLTDPFFYLVAIPAVFLLGLTKGGFAGIGVVAVPMMTLAVSPVMAASIILPILLVQDVVSVWSFRKTWDRSILILMLPAAAVGILLGWALAALVDEAVRSPRFGVIGEVRRHELLQLHPEVAVIKLDHVARCCCTCDHRSSTSDRKDRGTHR